MGLYYRVRGCLWSFILYDPNFQIKQNHVANYSFAEQTIWRNEDINNEINI